VAGSAQGATERALGGNTSLQKLLKVAVFRVLEHGTERLLIAAHAEQTHHVDVLETSHRSRVLVKLRPAKQYNTRMWANAQRDGRPAEYRWRPLFNAANFG